jgi:hypothetical protein
VSPIARLGVRSVTLPEDEVVLLMLPDTCSFDEGSSESPEQAIIRQLTDVIRIGEKLFRISPPSE